MSVKTSFFSLIMMIFFSLIAFEFYHWKDNRGKVEEMTQQYAQEMTSNMKRLLLLKEEAYKKQALDYSAWNQLVEMTHQYDPLWANDNLTGSVEQFGNDGLYWFDQNFKLLFSEARKESLKDISSLINIASFRPTDGTLRHFFVRSESEGVIEIFAAPIHRVNTPVSLEHPASGYIVITKVWDQALLKDLSSYGIATVQFGKGVLEPYMIFQDIPLYGADGSVVATLYLSAKNHLAEALDAYAIDDLKLSFGVGFILMVVFIGLILKWISFPLRDIMLALEHKDKEPLKKYLLKENEYDTIATALCESFDNKKALEQLNTNLEATIRHEVEQSRLKDRIVFQQSKVAALGEMLGNIAHQWKQPLNTISVVINKIYLDHQMQHLTPQTLEEALLKLRQHVQTMSSTIDEFRDFFTPDETQTTFNLYEIIEDALRMNDSGVVQSEIVFTVTCDDHIHLFGYKKEIAQLFLVLLSNAKEAIMRHEIAQGLVHIEVKEERDCVVVEVSDNGGGVQSEALPNLFEPFYTTKTPIGNSGMGLYFARKIVMESMQGIIEAFNKENGLVIRMSFPKPS